MRSIILAELDLSPKDLIHPLRHLKGVFRSGPSVRQGEMPDRYTSNKVDEKDALRSPAGRKYRSVGKSSLKTQVQKKERKLEFDIGQAERGIESLIQMVGRNNGEHYYILNTLVPKMRASLAISRRALVTREDGSCELFRRMNDRLDASFRSVLCVTSTVADEMARLLE